MASPVTVRLNAFASDPHNGELKPLIKSLISYVQLKDGDRQPEAIELAFEAFLTNKFGLIGHTGASERYVEKELPAFQKNISKTIQRIYQAHVNKSEGNPVQELHVLFKTAESIGNWANTPGPAFAELARDTCAIQ